MCIVVFLLNVIRVLLTKLHPCAGQSTPVGIRKAARATCILVNLSHLIFYFLALHSMCFFSFFSFTFSFNIIGSIVWSTKCITSITTRSWFVNRIILSNNISYIDQFTGILCINTLLLCKS